MWNCAATGTVSATGHVSSASGFQTAGQVSATGTITAGGAMAAASLNLSAPLPVASGGTGLSSPGTSGLALRSNGSSFTPGKVGLGVTGEQWNYPGRAFNTTYVNPYSYPIAVSATATCAFTSVIYAYVNGALVAFYQWQFNQCFSPDTQIRLWDGSVHTLLELDGKEVELRSLSDDMKLYKSKGKVILTHPDIETMDVHFSDGTVVTCTKIHKFVSVVSKYVDKLIYLQADHLVRGDLIYRDDAAPIMVTKVEFTGKIMDTYCPTMDEFHNFELANGMFTHNCGSYGGTFIIVPPGATYQLNSSQGVYNWCELY